MPDTLQQSGTSSLVRPAGTPAASEHEILTSPLHTTSEGDALTMIPLCVILAVLELSSLLAEPRNVYAVMRSDV